MNDLLADVNTYLNLKDNIIERVRQVLNDTTIDLNVRWDLFEQSHAILPTESFGDGYVETLSSKFTLYDDFYVDRYQTCDYVDMYEKVTTELEVDQENIDKWRELVLKSGYGSFEHDW